MGKVLTCGTSGGVASDDITVKREDIIAGKTAITADSDDEIVEGTLPEHKSDVVTQASGMSGNNYQMQFAKGAYRRTDLSNGSGGRVTVGLPTLRSNIGYTNPAKVLNDTTIAGQTGTIPIQGGSTIVPGTANKTAIAGGRYASGNILVSGDPNLVAGNIRDGVTIFGTRGNVVPFTTPSSITDYSGTVTAKDSSQGSSGSWNPNDSNKNTALIMRCYSGAWCIGRFNNGLNLTGWNYIDCYLTVSKNITEGYLGISQNPNLSSFSFTNSIKLNGSASQRIKLNVSANNGVWYLFLGIKDNAGINPGSYSGCTVRDVKLMTQ